MVIELAHFIDTKLKMRKLSNLAKPTSLTSNYTKIEKKTPVYLIKNRYRFHIHC